VGEYSTRMVWAGDHWDVALTEVIDGRTRLLAAIPLEDWIGLSATQYVLEMETEGAADAPRRVSLWSRGSRNRRGSLAHQPTPPPLVEMSTSGVSKICPVRGDLRLTKPQ
jgi:hypothetical protein